MFQHIEHADQIERLSKRTIAHVALHQRAADRCCAKRKPSNQSSRPTTLPSGHAWRDPEHVARAASNFEDRIPGEQLRVSFLVDFENQMISGSKPKMTVFDPSQLLEEGWVVAAGRGFLDRGCRAISQLLDSVRDCSRGNCCYCGAPPGSQSRRILRAPDRFSLRSL